MRCVAYQHSVLVTSPTLTRHREPSLSVTVWPFFEIRMTESCSPTRLYGFMGANLAFLSPSTAGGADIAFYVCARWPSDAGCRSASPAALPRSEPTPLSDWPQRDTDLDNVLSLDLGNRLQSSYHALRAKCGTHHNPTAEDTVSHKLDELAKILPILTVQRQFGKLLGHGS